MRHAWITAASYKRWYNFKHPVQCYRQFERGILRSEAYLKMDFSSGRCGDATSRVNAEILCLPDLRTHVLWISSSVLKSLPTVLSTRYYSLLTTMIRNSLVIRKDPHLFCGTTHHQPQCHAMLPWFCDWMRLKVNGSAWMMLNVSPSAWRMLNQNVWLCIRK